MSLSGGKETPVEYYPSNLTALTSALIGSRDRGRQAV